jgi:hypothetical protein
LSCSQLRRHEQRQGDYQTRCEKSTAQRHRYLAAKEDGGDYNAKPATRENSIGVLNQSVALPQ